MDTRNWFTLGIYIVQATLAVSTAIVVLRGNRQPVKTMAWLLVLGFLPIFGVVLFFFFGRDVRKEKYINKHSLDLLERQTMSMQAETGGIVLREPHAELIRLFENQNVALPLGDNHVDVYTDGYEFFPALLKAVKEAREHIHLVTYIFDDDSLGKMVADALAKNPSADSTEKIIRLALAGK